MLIDYHIHNHFSPDSGEDTRKIVEKALELGIQEICITNHPEAHTGDTGKDVFDLNEAKERFGKIKKELDAAQKEYPKIRIRFGIELGYHEKRMNQLTELVGETDFDFILGSVHVVKGVVIPSHLFAGDLYSKTDEKTAYSAYFTEMMKLIRWGHLDAVAHFDICKKHGHKFYGPFQPEKYKDQILPILKLMSKKGIGLELNTGCMENKCREVFPHPVILKWAVAAGIRNFTIGSDAHKAKNVGRHIQEAMEIAKKAGITHLSTYRRHKPTLRVF